MASQLTVKTWYGYHDNHFHNYFEMLFLLLKQLWFCPICTRWQINTIWYLLLICSLSLVQRSLCVLCVKSTGDQFLGNSCSWVEGEEKSLYPTIDSSDTQSRHMLWGDEDLSVHWLVLNLCVNLTHNGLTLLTS